MERRRSAAVYAAGGGVGFIRNKVAVWSITRIITVAKLPRLGLMLRTTLFLLQ